MAKDPKKYPWIKSIFKKNKKNPEIIEGVYAGPDMWNGKEKEIECVYAGPDMFGGINQGVGQDVDQDVNQDVDQDVDQNVDPDAPEAEIEDVYAGPGIPPMALVYAEPDYFKRKAEDATPEDATPEDANAENNSENPEGLA